MSTGSVPKNSTGFPSADDGVALVVPQLDHRVLVGLEIAIRDGPDASRPPAVVEGRQRQAEGVPEVRSREREGDILDRGEQ